MESLSVNIGVSAVKPEITTLGNPNLTLYELCNPLEFANIFMCKPVLERYTMYEFKVRYKMYKFKVRVAI